MLEAAQKAASKKLTLLGVTILTSHSQDSVSQIGISKPISDEVDNLMQLAKASGISHVVCSPSEIAVAKKYGLISVVPGIREIAIPDDDQSRVATAKEAFASGANFIVVGRPITKSVNPLEVYEYFERSANE